MIQEKDWWRRPEFRPCLRRWLAEKKIYEAGPEKAARYARQKSAAVATRLLVIGLVFRDPVWAEKFLAVYMEPD